MHIKSTISVRAIHIILALVFFVVGYIYDEYRPAMTFWFSGNIPNIYAVIITCALIGAAYNKHQIKNVVGVTIGLIGYEVLQFWLPERTFDLWDIAASVMGMLCYLVMARWFFQWTYHTS